MGEAKPTILFPDLYRFEQFVCKICLQFASGNNDGSNLDSLLVIPGRLALSLSF